MNNKFNVKWAILSCLLICSVGSSAHATGTETLSTEKESTLTHKGRPHIGADHYETRRSERRQLIMINDYAGCPYKERGKRKTNKRGASPSTSQQQCYSPSSEAHPPPTATCWTTAARRSP